MISSTYIDPLDRSVADLLARKPKGSFRVENVGGRAVITVNRPGEPEEIIFCLSRGHANQMRQSLTDEGLAGFMDGAL